jgi:D-amino-acid dehydrogenase
MTSDDRLASSAGAHERADVVVIGGGAVGAWCALSLARAGRSILLLEERDQVATRASFGNSGLLTVSAAGPLAEPGIVGRALRWSIQPNGPVRIRPRLSVRTAVWTRQFWAAGERSRATTSVSLGLVRQSRALLEELDGESEIDFMYRQAGLVACFTTGQAHELALASLDKYAELGVEALPLDTRAVRLRSPLVGERVVGGIFYPEDAAVDPAAMTRATVEAACAIGARLVTGVRVQGLVNDGPSRAAVETSVGRLRAEEIVVAAGYGSLRVLSSLTVRPMIEAGRGYSDDVASPRPGLGAPLRLVERRIVATPLGDRLRISSKLEFGYADESVAQRRADGSLRQAARYLPDGSRLRRTRAPWTGVRPLTPDGLPLVGRDPTIANLTWATGHGHLGISHAPATGQLVRSLLTEDDAPAELALLRVDRFGRERRASAVAR